MRVMIDTNILIYREDDAVVSGQLQELIVNLNSVNADIIVHPASITDLMRDREEKRRDIILSKLKTYKLLDRPPNAIIDNDYINIVSSGDLSSNDFVDIQILYALYKDAVDFLITEDRDIHNKARRLNIEDRVLLISDAIRVIDQYLPKPSFTPPLALRDDYVYNLNTADPIFESLREDYVEFDEWLAKIKREGRHCFVHFREDGSIGALLIYKIEDEAIDSDPPLPKKKRLKIATLKVTHVGYKLGELLIKLSTDIAIRNGITEVYLTHFTEELADRLVELIVDYGFYKATVNRRGEEIYIKRLYVESDDISDMTPLAISRRYYPSFYDGPRINKFIIPIWPEYQDRLFTDFPGRQATLQESAGDFIIEGNTIKKAYICHSKARAMQPGDIIIFYVSRRSILTSVGIVETVERDIIEPDAILKMVGKRTVYSKQEIEEIAKKPTTVILFRHHFHLRNTLTLNQLRRWEILSTAPQSITKINNHKYQTIKTRGGIDVRFTVN